MSYKKDSMFKKPVASVATLIFQRPNETFHLRGLAKETGLSTTAVVSAIQTLASLDIINTKDTGITTAINADLASDAYRDHKRLFNLHSLFPLMEDIKERCRPQAIVLFGSYSRGEDIESSDIDLLLLAPIKDIDLTAYEKRLKRKIHLTALDTLKNSSAEFKNAIANGIVLHGYVVLI